MPLPMEAQECAECKNPERPLHYHEDGTVAAPSSDGVSWYSVTISCTCLAGQNGGICKHILGAATYKREHKSTSLKKAAQERKDRIAAGGPSRKPVDGTPVAKPQEPGAPGTLAYYVANREKFVEMGWDIAPIDQKIAELSGLAELRELPAPTTLGSLSDPRNPAYNEFSDAPDIMEGPEDRMPLFFVGDVVKFGGKGSERSVLGIEKRKLTSGDFVTLYKLSDGSRVAAGLLTLERRATP